jgi:hypothetical protein
MAAPLDDPAPLAELHGIRIEDGQAFGSLDPEACRSLWGLSRDHADKMRKTVEANNLQDVVRRWERECQWRSRAWYLLDDVIHCPQYTLEKKLQSLKELRDLIGEEAYYAGMMPQPTPSYRGLER